MFKNQTAANKLIIEYNRLRKFDSFVSHENFLYFLRVCHCNCVILTLTNQLKSLTFCWIYHYKYNT